MKNNLLKSVATVATASALLFSTVTSFAASATTVTTYNEGGKIGVTSTIKDVAVGTMVTYLASQNGTVNTANDIFYIGQKTSDGKEMTFSYTLPDRATKGKVAGDVLARIKYGSDNADTATGLNTTDTKSQVKYGTVTIVSNNCTVTPAKQYIGNGEKVNVTIGSIDAGYEVKEIYVNENLAGKEQTTIQVESGDELVVICGAITNNTTSAVKVMDCNETTVEGKTMKGIVCHGSVSSQTADSSVKFGVVAKKGNAPYNMPGIKDGFYEAEATTEGFYAVQLETTEDITLEPAYKTSNGINQ